MNNEERFKSWTEGLTGDFTIEQYAIEQGVELQTAYQRLRLLHAAGLIERVSVEKNGRKRQAYRIGGHEGGN